MKNAFSTSGLLSPEIQVPVMAHPVTCLHLSLACIRGISA